MANAAPAAPGKPDGAPVIESLPRPGWLSAECAPDGEVEAEGSAELRDVVEEAIGQLSDTYREVVGQFLLTSASPGRIASDLGLTEKGLYLRAARGLGHLRGLLPLAEARRAGLAAVTASAAPAPTRRAPRNPAPRRRARRTSPGAIRRRRYSARSVGLALALIAGASAAAAGWMLASPTSEADVPRDRDEVAARADAAAQRLRGREVPRAFPAAPALVELPSPAEEPQGQLPASTDRPLSEAAATWLAAFVAATSQGQAEALGESMAALPPADAMAIAREIFPALTVEQRMGFPAPFLRAGDHPFTLELLDLQARDPEYRVQSRAWESLRSLAFRDLGVARSTYGVWAESVDSMSLTEAVRHSAEWFAGRALRATDEQRLVVLTGARPPASPSLRNEVAAILAASEFVESLPLWLAAEDEGLRAAAKPWAFVLEAAEPPTGR